MKYLTWSITIPVLLGLSACTTTAIKATNSSAALAGTLKTGLQEHGAELVYNGKTYRGAWRESAVSSEQVAQVSYPHRKHLTNIFLDLAASDGSELKCSGLTHGMQGDLTCNVDGRILAVRLN